MHLLQRVLAVGRVHLHAIGQHFHPLADRAQTSVERCADIVRKAQLEHFPRGVLRDQLARRAFGDDRRLVHHHQPIAETLGLIHVMRGQQQCRSAALQLIQPIPHHVPRLRIEARRRLVEQNQIGLVHERARNRQAPLHAARQRLDLRGGAIGQLDELEQFVRALPGDVPRNIEVPRIHQQVLANRNFHIEVVLLRDDAEPRLDATGIGARIHVEHTQLAVARRRRACDHPHRRGLPCPVRAEKSERLAGMHVEVDAIDGGECTKALGQSTRMDQIGVLSECMGTVSALPSRFCGSYFVSSDRQEDTYASCSYVVVGVCGMSRSGRCDRRESGGSATNSSGCPRRGIARPGSVLLRGPHRNVSTDRSAAISSQRGCRDRRRHHGIRQF